MDNKILYMEMTNYQPEARDMAIFGKRPGQKNGQIAFILP